MSADRRQREMSGIADSVGTEREDRGQKTRRAKEDT